MDGKYVSGNLKSGNENVDIKGKKIESVPNVISRTGATFQIKKISFSTLLSHTASSFADPLNTVAPNATGTIGLVPAYTLLDINSTLNVNRNIKLKASINNLTDKQYFTKRPLFYPGPGIWPSDGRSITFSVIFKI